MSWFAKDREAEEDTGLMLKDYAEQYKAIGMAPSRERNPIDEGVARDCICPKCGNRMSYQAFRYSDGSLGASVAYCQRDFSAITF